MSPRGPDPLGSGLVDKSPPGRPITTRSRFQFSREELSRTPKSLQKLNPSLFPATPEPAKSVPYVQRPPKPTMRQDRKGMNKLEQAFLHYLHALPNIRFQRREGILLRLGNGVTYRPDFTGWDYQPSVSAFCCYEVKGGFFREDARVKTKVAASLFPFFRFYLAHQIPRKRGGGWKIEEVMP